MHQDSFFEALKKAPNPAYVLDESALTRNAKTLAKVQELAKCKVLCAFKGYAMWSSFDILSQHIGGATASSLNEVKLCREKWGKLAHSCFVVYQEEEFDEVLANSSHITFNSLSQYRKFKDKVLSNPSVQFALRLNPEHSIVGVEKYNPCAPGSRFGVTLDQLEAQLPEGITGIHIHGLCESSAEDLEELLESIERKFGHLLHEALWLNLGGGHHITREGYDIDLFVQLLRNLRSNYALDIIIEPGEAIGWETGVLLSQVEDVVKSNGEKTAVLNVSFSAHMPDCLEMPYKPSVKGEVPAGKPYTLAGNTCMSGDFVKGFHFDQDLKEGDSVIFYDMMHYTFVKTTTFNGVPHPSLCKVSETGQLKVIRNFGYEDYLNRLS